MGKNMLDITTVKLADIPDLKDSFNADARKQKFSNLENEWLTAKNRDMSEDEINDYVDSSQSDWEDYFYSEIYWINSSYEDKDPSSLHPQLGCKYVGDENHYITIFYDKATNEIVCWSMDID
jgi:hypothetical protein